MIFSLAWNIIFTDNLKVLVLKFLEMKNMVFLSQKVDGNMIFTDYWKVLVLIFLGIRNKVFSWAKKLMERWYLLITEKILFWTFRWWEIRSFFESSWWKNDIYMVFLAFYDIPETGKYGFLRSDVNVTWWVHIRPIIAKKNHKTLSTFVCCFNNRP